MMISLHCFRWWLGAVRHQAITWTNVDQVLWHQLVLLGHNELKTLQACRRQTKRKIFSIFALLVIKDSMATTHTQCKHIINPSHTGNIIVCDNKALGTVTTDVLNPTSPGHQKPWYGLQNCKIGRSLFYFEKGFISLCPSSTISRHRAGPQLRHRTNVDLSSVRYHGNRLRVLS